MYWFVPKSADSAQELRTVATLARVRIEEIDYEVGGRRMVGQLAVDEYRPGLRPAVLLCHEGLGLEEHVKGRAVRLAGLGYLPSRLTTRVKARPRASRRSETRLWPASPS